MPSKPISVTAAAFAGLATATVLAWPGTAATATDGQSRYPLTLRLTAQTDQFAFVDHGPPGTGVGDQLVFSDRVYRDGIAIGTAASTCTMVRVSSPTMTCSLLVAFALPDGQLTLHGISDGPDHPPAPGEQVRFTLAVTGGTGHYRTARGDAEGVDTGGGQEQYTIRLTR